MSRQLGKGETDYLYRERIINWLIKVLKRRGFDVKRNIVIEGNGVSHRFDVVADLMLLPSSKITIGVVIADKTVDLDFVEKLLGWSDEMRTLKIVVVALDKVDPKAYVLASKYGIDIITPPKDAVSLEGVHGKDLGIETLHTEPRVSVENIAEQLANRVKRSLFKSTKCELEKIGLIYYPLVEISVEAPIVRRETGEAEILEASMVFDGLNGYLITTSGGSLSVLKEHGRLTDIPDEAHMVLKILSENSSAELDVLNAKTRIDQHTLKALTVELSMHGLVDIYGDLVEFKGLNKKIFTDLEGWLRKHGVRVEKGEPVSNDHVIKLEPSIPLFKIEDLIKSMGAEIVSIRLIYYPLYAALLKEVKGDVKLDKIAVYDGITGDELDDFSVLVTTPELIDKLRSIKGYPLHR